MPSEHSPLLENGGRNTVRRTFGHRVLSFIKGEGQPGFLRSYQYIFLESWVNLLLVFMPVSCISHYMQWDAGVRFLLSFLAIIPLAKLIGEATDQMSIELGETVSGLLNASFGNAVEIIVGLAALLQGQLRIVQTSLLGSILGNILLVLGSSFIAGGFVHDLGEFQVIAAQTSASLMTLGCITLVIPAAYRASKSTNRPAFSNEFSFTHRLPSTTDSTESEASHGLNVISRGTAILLLVVYVSYLYFQLKTHSYLFRSQLTQQGGAQQESAHQGAVRRGSLQQERARQRVVQQQGEVEQEEEKAEMNTFAAATALLLVTVLTAFCADWLVASIEETAERYHISRSFIGLILIPIVANAAEHTTSIWMAVRGKYELTMSICIGSAIQIALFVVPLLVLVGWMTGHHLTLFFEDFETIILFVSVVLVNLLIMDGKSNYMEGLMLVTLYIVVALAFWVS